MQFFDRKFALIILFITLPLLFLPKLNLISVDAEETAGLRIDDLVLLFLGLFLIGAHTLSRQKLYHVEGWILLITAFGIFSFLVNRLLVSLGILTMDSKIYYSLRLLEYFLFFYLGAMASQYLSHRFIIQAFFLWNLLFMLLQKLDLVGGIIATGYHGDMSGRVQGIASFPSEMGLLLNLIFCYLVFDDPKTSHAIKFFKSPFTACVMQRLSFYGLFCLFGIFIVFTGNRISIVALAVCFLFRLKQDLSKRSLSSYLSMILLIPIAAFAIAFVITKTAGVYERSIDLFSWKNLELFSLVWEKIDVTQNPLGHEVVNVQDYDMSWWLRIHKWLFMSKTFCENPECYLQGLGPGYAGAALDGGLLRILTEYGLIGAFLFWKFFSCLFRINAQTKWMSIAFLINMIFFDAYLAYKTMSLLLFTCGCLFECRHRPVDFSKVCPAPSA